MEGVLSNDRKIDSCDHHDHIGVSVLYHRCVVRASKQTTEKKPSDIFLVWTLHGYNRYYFNGTDCRAVYVFRQTVIAWIQREPF